MTQTNPPVTKQKPVAAQTVTSTQQQSTKTSVDDSMTSADNNQPHTVVHPLTFDQKETTAMAKSHSPSPLKFVVAGVVAVLLGIATGYGSFELYAKSNGIPTGEPIQQVASGEIQEGDVFGSANADDFPNPAKGYLEAGGMEGEGTHTLLRPGGPSQSVTLTSSVTDLDKLVGMEVEVWGETFKGQKAGWLMDVGRVQVIKVQGEQPTE